ncbi:MAG: ATP-grasp fold amidoligase family protein [Bryobacteraceae bacterium]
MAKGKTRYAEELTYRARILRLLPRNDLGDWLFAAILFRRSHGRWPQRSGGLISDAMFRLRASAEITRPLRVYVTDKEQLKDYVRGKLGDRFNVPTIALLRSREEIDRFEFPQRCVIKPTHMSGSVILRMAGEPIDLDRLARWFAADYYDYARERNYRGLTPKIIVEPFVFDQNWPNAFRIFCLHGRARLLHVNIDRPGELTRSFYDPDWNALPIFSNDRASAGFPRPANLSLILQVAETLSRDFDFIRVDLYSDDVAVKVSELTNCPFNALFPFASRESEELASQAIFGGVDRE